MRAYSCDLRERVLAAIDAGTRRADAAATFRISKRTMTHCWLDDTQVCRWRDARG